MRNSQLYLLLGHFYVMFSILSEIGINKLFLLIMGAICFMTYFFNNRAEQRAKEDPKINPWFPFGPVVRSAIGDDIDKTEKEHKNKEEKK